MTDIPTWKQKLEQQYINLAFDPAAALSDLSKKEASYLKKKKDEVTIRSSAAEYLTYVASVGGQQDSIEMNISTICLSRFEKSVSLSVDFIRR